MKNLLDAFPNAQNAREKRAVAIQRQLFPLANLNLKRELNG
jgi:hypothetical protein